MGLRVGIVTRNPRQENGGEWIFSATVIDGLARCDSPHVFIDLEKLPPPPPEPLPSRYGFLQAVARWLAALRSKSAASANGVIEMPSETVEQVETLESRARRENIDIVWFMHPLGEVMSIPYIATVWDLEHRTRPYFPEVSSTGFTWPEREKLYNDLLPRASIIITGTQAGKEEIVHYYRVNPANVVVDPFPVPSEALLEQTSEDIELKEKYGLIGDFLIYPAQFWPHKNHINLLRAFKILRDRENLDLRLVLTGSDKGNLDYVAKTIADLGLGDRVFLLGFIARADLIALYRGAVALVFPSFFGPDNLPPLEAFAIGCPVVAANVAGAQEQLGEAALLFDPSDPADMAAKIALVCRAPELRAKMICKGAEIARLRTPQAYIATLCAALDRFEAIRRCWVGV